MCEPLETRFANTFMDNRTKDSRTDKLRQDNDYNKNVSRLIKEPLICLSSPSRYSPFRRRCFQIA